MDTDSRPSSLKSIRAVGFAIALLFLIVQVSQNYSQVLAVLESLRYVSTEDSTRHDQSRNNNLNGSKSNSNKLILYWSKKYFQDWVEPVGSRRFASCKYKKCELTADKGRLREADMLLFFNRDVPNFPSYRSSNQLYVHICRDPPLEPEETYLDAFEDHINITVSYRHDADIYLPNGRFLNAAREFSPKIPLKSKTRSVVWPVSHCVTPSKRRQYVDELQKYIDVDIYGMCGNLTCPRTETYMSCLKDFEKTYKFYLSFENRFCQDYFTEKLFNPMQVELVPIVLGLVNYSRDLVPPHSVIDVRDFTSPRHLAEYLHFLADNQTEYYKYFDWKRNYTVTLNHEYYCSICEALHTDKHVRDGAVQPSYKRSDVGSYRDWWQGVCQNDIMDRMRQQGGW